MPKTETIHYPDGTRRHVSVNEREQLLLALEIVKLSDRNYRFLGQLRTFHAMSELEQLLPSFREQFTRRRFLGGVFVFEFEGKKHREMMETPEGLAARLAKMGMLNATV